MAYGDCKDLTRKTNSKKMLFDKAFNIVMNLKYNGYQHGYVSSVYKCFNKKSSGSVIKREYLNKKKKKELAEELHKPITWKFKKQKIYSSFIGNIGGPDLADIQLIGKSVKEIRFYICVIDIFSKYAWIIS